MWTLALSKRWSCARSYWGEAVVWGTENKVDSPEQCCAQCAAYRPQHEEDIYCNGALLLTCRTF